MGACWLAGYVGTAWTAKSEFNKRVTYQVFRTRRMVSSTAARYEYNCEGVNKNSVEPERFQIEEAEEDEMKQPSRRAWGGEGPF